MVCEFAKLPDDIKHLEGVRLLDLVAKISKVPVKNVAKVLGSLELVSWMMEIPVEELVGADYSLEPANKKQAAMCDAAFATLCDLLCAEDDRDAIDKIRSL